MKNAEMKVVKFSAEDVIATSGFTMTQSYIDSIGNGDMAFNITNIYNFGQPTESIDYNYYMLGDTLGSYQTTVGELTSIDGGNDKNGLTPTVGTWYYYDSETFKWSICHQ